MADLAVQGQGLLVVLGGLPVAALPPVDDAKVVQRAGFAIAVIDRAGQGEGLLVVLGGLLVVALPLVDEAEVVQRTGFADPVADLTV